MTPWEAAVQFGYVEPAFEHLRHLTSPPPSSIPRQTTPHQQRTTALLDLQSSRHDHLTNAVNGMINAVTYLEIGKGGVVDFSNQRL